MPQNKDLKRLIRNRMAKTGERYTTARSSLTQHRNEPDAEDARTLLQRAAGENGSPEAWVALKALEPERLQALTVEGLGDNDWRVRRACARLLDDLALTEATTRALVIALDDPHPKVRAGAFHTLVCEGCKPDACVPDVRAIVVKMLRDPSADVRQRVLATMWEPHWRADSALVDAIRALTAGDPSGYVRAEAQRFLDGVRATRKNAVDRVPPA